MSDFLRTVIVGPSECGKTTLGNELQRQYARRGVPGLACSLFPEQWPTCRHAWPAERFLEYIAFAKRARGCVLCVDESGQTMKRKVESEWIVTTSRHNHHDAICLSHGGTAFTPTMRSCFNVICLFASAEDICETWARDFNDPDLMQASARDFPQYEFLLKRRFQPVRRVKLALS